MPNTIVMAALVSIIFAILGGLQGMRMGYDQRVAEEAQVNAAAKAGQDKALAAAAKEIARIDVKNVTIQGKIVERVRTEKVYTECKHSPDTWALVQEAYK